MFKEEMVGQHCVCKFGMCNILFAAVPEIDQLETGSSPAPGRHQGCHNPRLWSRRLCNLSTLSTVCVSRTAEHCRMTHVNIANADVLIPKCDLLHVLTADTADTADELWPLCCSVSTNQFSAAALAWLQTRRWGETRISFHAFHH